MTRIDVPFTITKQRIAQVPRMHICATSRNYFYATFKLCDAWANIADVYAVFTRDVPYIVPLAVGMNADPGCLECRIPWEVLADVGNFKVGLFGGDRMLTNEATVYVTEGCVCDGQDPSEPTADVLQRVLDASVHPPIPSEVGFWLLWDANIKTYILSNIPCPSAGGNSGGGSDDDDDGSDCTCDPKLGQRVQDLETAVADLLYKPITITSFTANASTLELGSKITSVTLSWQLSKEPAMLVVNGVSIEPDGLFGSKTLSNLNIIKTTTFNMAATDNRGANATKSVTINFYNGVYYGTAVVPEVIDSTFVLGLAKKELTSTRKRTITVNAADGQYIWYALPTRLGECVFTVGGFEGGFSLVDTVAFTNSKGYTENYYIYRSDNAVPGETKAVIT